jgi:hypothetical protein
MFAPGVVKLTENEQGLALFLEFEKHPPITKVG